MASKKKDTIFPDQNSLILDRSFFLLFTLLFLFGCISKNQVEVKLKKSSAQKNVSLPITVSNVEVINHQVIIKGTNLESIKNFLIKDGAASTALQIESQTTDTIVAKTMSNVTFAAGKILDFILSNADAASTFTVNFSLCDSSLGGKAFNCLITPNDKEVLSYDAASGKWQPRAVNGLSYIGTFDASAGANPAAKPAGQYYIVSVAGDIDAGATILGVGDWIVSNGSSWQKIDNSTVITSVHGRTGAVVGAEGDYTLTQLDDVTVTAPVNNQILKYNGTTWVNSDLSALGGGTVTSVSGTPPITVSNGTSTPAISISQANTTTNGYITSADWNTFNNKQPTIAVGTTAQYYRGDKSWQTLDTLAVPENTNLYFTNARALGVPLSGFVTDTNAIVATDTVLQAFGKAQGQINNLTSGGSNFLVKNGTDSITGVVNVNTIGALAIGYTPTNMTDATSKSYVDSQRDSRVAKTGDTMTGDLQINTKLKLQDSGTNTVSLQAPTTITTSYVLKLPTALGTNNQVLTTDAAGNLSWTSPATSTAPNGTAGGDLSGSYPNPTISALDAIKIGGGAVDNTEFSYLNGVTSSIQTQLNAKLSSFTESDPGVTAFAKAALPTCAAGEVLKADGTILSCVTDNSGAGSYSGGNNLVVVTNGSGALSDSTISTTELGHLSGVSSNIQTQLSAKQATISKTTVQDVSKLRIYGANATNYVELSAAALTGNRSLVFPDSDGSNGYVLSTNGSGTLSWIAIPSAPVSTVHGRTGAVVGANGDYTASQVTNVAAGNIAATTTQAAIDELDSEKQNIATLAADVRAVVLTGLSTATNAAIAATDSVLDAFGKLQAQISSHTTSIGNKADQTNLSQIITAATVTGLTTPLAASDAANKAYVDAALTSGTNNSIISGWPDFITCNVTNPSWGQVVLPLFVYNYTPNGLTYYRGPVAGSVTPMTVTFTTSTKTQATYETIITSDCDGKTIAQLYAAGKAFNVAKGPVAQWLQNGSNAYYNAGNVGIGTNDPVSRVESLFDTSLHTSAQFLARTPTNSVGQVAGVGFATGTGAISGTNSLGSIYATITQASPLKSDITIRNNIGNNLHPIATFASSGYVGINTTNPQTTLDVNGSISSQGPAGEATSGAVSAPTGGITTVTGYTVAYSVGSGFNATTGVFQPTVAGRYLFTANAYSGVSSNWVLSVCKNGSCSRGGPSSAVAGNGSLAQISKVVNLNGSSDYAYISIGNFAGSTATIADVNITWTKLP